MVQSIAYPRGGGDRSEVNPAPPLRTQLGDVEFVVGTDVLFSANHTTHGHL